MSVYFYSFEVKLNFIELKKPFSNLNTKRPSFEPRGTDLNNFDWVTEPERCGRRVFMLMILKHV